jgi:hypothetical protein
MSKKKNTLQDLDDFLKQQAATLVTPETLNDTVEPKQIIEKVELQTQKQNDEKTSIDEFQLFPSTQDPAFRSKLYNFIIESLETQKDSIPEDKMLINTALYLKSGDDWKNAIRQYWRGR